MMARCAQTSSCVEACGQHRSAACQVCLCCACRAERMECSGIIQAPHACVPSSTLDMCSSQPRSHFEPWGFAFCGQTPRGAVVRHPLAHADGPGFDSPCAQQGGQSPHGSVVGHPLHTRAVLGSNPRVPRGVAKRRMVRWSDTCCKCGKLGFESQCALPSGRPGHNE